MPAPLNPFRKPLVARITAAGQKRGSQAAFDASINAGKSMKVGHRGSMSDRVAAARAASAQQGGIDAMAQFDRRAKYGAGAAVAMSAGVFRKKSNESRTSYRGPGSAGLRNPRGTGRYA